MLRNVSDVCWSLRSDFAKSVQTMSKPIFRVVFLNQAEVYEVYARSIYQSELYGFIEVEEFIFDERSKVLVDPAEEKLKTRFSGVNRSYIPLHAIIRIDEVEKEGVAKISEVKGKTVTPFPSAVHIPGQGNQGNKPVE